MKKKIVCMLLLTGLLVGVPFNDVMAAQHEKRQNCNWEEKKEKNNEKEWELLKKYTEKQNEKLVDEYMNLEITLPEEYVYQEENNLDASAYSLMATTYSTTSTPSGICTSGTATRNSIC